MNLLIGLDDMNHRFGSMFRVLLLSLALSMPTIALPNLALAQGAAGNPLDGADGRLRGYEQNSVYMDDSSTALAYFALAGLTLLCIGLMFKSSRRTHLD
jgi:hypothetical protein